MKENSKFQRPSSREIPMINNQSAFARILKLGAWSFSGCWCLVLGILPLFALPANAAAAPEPEPPSLTVRVMTFNIQHGAGADEKVNLARTAQAIREQKPDIVALEEVDKGVARTGRQNLPMLLGSMTGMTPYFSNNFNFEGGEHGNAVLTRYHILMETNTHYQMIRTNEQRGVIQMILDVNGHKLLFLDTHLDERSRDNKQRLMNVAEIKEIVKKHPGLPVVICGDFNETPGSRVYKAMKKSFDDVWAKAGDGKGLTYPSPTPTNRVDYIWISRDKSVEPIIAWVPETQASDHRPLVAELRLR
jgi:endonuclease/exonuclease/phosphatase family metal-dependent hydrolase